VGQPLVARDFLMSSQVGVNCDVKKYEREREISYVVVKRGKWWKKLFGVSPKMVLM
jgi:hypothetical protein